LSIFQKNIKETSCGKSKKYDSLKIVLTTNYFASIFRRIYLMTLVQTGEAPVFILAANENLKGGDSNDLFND